MDAGRRRLVKISIDGDLLHEVALSGGDDGALRVEPADLIVDARGSVLILDRASASILAYDKGGALLASAALAPDLADEVRDPRSALIQDSFGRLWLLAPRERDLVRLNASLARDRTGRFLTPEDRVTALDAIATTPKGETWVAGATPGELLRFHSSGALAGRIRINDSTSGTTWPVRIVALAADGSGYIYAADRTGQRILVFDGDGTRVFEQVLGGNMRAWHPSTLAWSFRNDRLAAADSELGEVQIFGIGRRAGYSPAPRAP